MKNYTYVLLLMLLISSSHGIFAAEADVVSADTTYIYESEYNKGIFKTESDTVLSAFEKYAFNAPERQKRNAWKAAAEVTAINVLVHSFDRFVLKKGYAKTTFKSVGKNITEGFVWDNDNFSTNLFAHPYHGSLYFNAARNNGFNFWESLPYAFGGSLMWELAGEKEPPAINDLLATTLGGICIGEISNRISALILNEKSRGMRRFLRELASFAICPMRGVNRITNGDAWKVRDRNYLYHDYERIPVTMIMSAGDRYLADDGALFRGEHNPYIDLFLEYGDHFDNEENKPYDYFMANMTFGLSKNQPLINSIHLLGRLWGAPILSNKDVEMRFGMFQHFNYYDSKPVKDGSGITPYRISEAAAFGPGIIYKFLNIGSLTRLEQRVFLDAILLGGTKSDYYNVADRDYNMGSGFSVKVQTFMQFRRRADLVIKADYYRIFTWKGYGGGNLETADPLYLNAQGDKGNAELLVINPILGIHLKDNINVEMSGSYFIRNTRYKCYDTVRANTFEIRLGLAYVL